MSRRMPRPSYHPMYGHVSSSPVADAWQATEGWDRAMEGHIQRNHRWVSNGRAMGARRRCVVCRAEGLINIFGMRKRYPK